MSSKLLDQIARSSWSSMFLWPWGWLPELPPLKVPGQQRSLVRRNSSAESKKGRIKNLQIATCTKVKPLTQKLLFCLFV